VALFHQNVHEVGADETGPTGDEYTHQVRLSANDLRAHQGKMTPSYHTAGIANVKQTGHGRTRAAHTVFSCSSVLPLFRVGLAAMESDGLGLTLSRQSFRVSGG
jgi:hypothetical protein